ncbi:kinetochore protein NUF2 homolog [Lotus japonicus]|uniref:kinetochore protein NUF2 homolog n=1 Tax=Lotus japonicus TaxID=34305 RepID=UPI0025852DBF|nr:kinetochore protein NUF2 homolog [Lotus japonicus]XP_057422082.1 kinetochore protein NUF2 homolog [Lotus japonicus]
MAVSNYEYPRLRRPEIAAILAQFQIANVTEQDISNPNPDLIYNLYTRILIHLDFLLEEDNEQLNFDDLEQLENPDLHVESVRAIKLYTKIKELLDALECPRKFTFADLLMPEPQKTEFFLGALLNFCLDRDSRMNSISEIVDEFNALEMQRTELEENRILQLKAEISECNEAREREMPLVQEVDAKVRELRQTIGALNHKQVSLRTTIKKLKEDKDPEMDQKISNAEFTLVQSVQENVNLRSKIAQSPDKIQRALEEKKLAREEARNAERLYMQTFHEKSALVEVYSKVQKKMSKHYQQMQAIQEQVNSAKSIEKDLKELKAKLSDEEVLEKSLEAKLVERQSKVEQMEELRKQLEKECSTMCEEATNYLSSAKSEVESKRCTLETRQRNVEAVLSEVDAVNCKITSVKELASVRVEQLDRKCEEIVVEFHKYANSISRVIKSGPEATERGEFDIVDPV